VQPVSNLTVLREFPAGCCLDGGHSFGQVIATRAMAMAVDRARTTGIACVGVRNGGHIGAHGNVAIQAAQQGMLGFLMTNGRPVLAPPGGKVGAVSSTPFAFGCPSGRRFPLVLDMALSVVARGNIIRAITEGTEIPPHWAVDASGRPTTDPRAAAVGAVLPIGGHKGYGLAVMLGVLGGVLTGAAFGNDVAPHEPPDPDQPFNQGHFVLALNIEHFMPMAQFMARADAFVQEIKATPLAEGATEIFVPGEQSYRRWQERLERGLSVGPRVADKLRTIGQSLGVDFDAYASNKRPGADQPFSYQQDSA
jgi:LDH2 family malate/lactate/ureidoglycolate dehydrogenase